MKTPEEIKNGLIHCSEIGCVGCPYHDEDCSPHNPFQKCADDALMLIQQLENQITDLGKKVPKWIDVDERLPDKNENVLIAANGYVHSAAYYEYSDGMAFSTETGDDIFCAGHGKDKVTHWMPLPEPPKEEQHD